MGGTPLFSIARGAGEEEKAHRIMGNVFSLLSISSLLLTVLCYLLRRPIMFLFGASEASYVYADAYLKIYLLGTPLSMLATGMNGFINAQGFPRMGMLTVIIGAALNLVLDPLFIFVLDMGNREGQIITSGKAIDIYTDYYIDQMWDNMVGYLSDGDYYNAFFSLYMDMNELAGEYEQYQTDPDSFISDYSKAQKQKSIFTSLGIAAIFSLVIAGFAVSSMKKACRNVRPYTDGRAYLKENGFYLTTNQDSFATTHTSMMPIPRDDDDHHSGGIGGSWGGGSSTFSGGGRSFGGGGGKF
jgi:hypothetical protein